MTASEVEAIAARIGTELEPDGWTVWSSEGNGSFSIQFAHPLAGEIGPVVKADEPASKLDDLAHRVMQTNPIFALVRERPSNLAHPQTMHTVRVTAKMADWAPEDMRHVCNILLEVGQLNEDEAEWVVRAGPW